MRLKRFYKRKVAYGLLNAISQEIYLGNILLKFQQKGPPDKPRASLLNNVSLQSRHIDHKTIADITFKHPCIRSGNVFYIDQLDVGHNIMLSAKVKHFLGFRNASNA